MVKTETILNLNTVIHAPLRLAVLSILISVENADFNYLKEATGATDGNLSTHLGKLEQSGLIRISKSFKGKKPHTTCGLTSAGRKAFLAYLDQLEEICRLRDD